MFEISIPGDDELYYKCIQHASPKKGCLKSKHQDICIVVLSQVQFHSDRMRGMIEFDCERLT